MQKKIFSVFMLALSMFLIQSCGGEHKETDLVESGTYKGIAEEVEPAEKEIYVKTEDDKLLELYFKENTRLTKNGNTVPFDSIPKGAKVEVKLEKKGKRLEPLHVKILQ